MNPLAGNTRLIRLVLNLFLARFSPSDIERLGRHPLRIGLAGGAESIQTLKMLLVEGTVSPKAPFPSLSLHPLPTEDPANAWSVIDDCQMVVVLLGREHLLGDTVHRIKEALPEKVPSIWAVHGEVEPWLRFEIAEIVRELKLPSVLWLDDLTPDDAQPLLKSMVRQAGHFEIAMARKLPMVRDLVASRIIARTGRQNLLIAMASALPATIPWIGPIIGILGVSSEIIFLTANQLRMALQVSTVYDQESAPAQRLGELLPIVASGFGWRAISRELVGFIPAIGPGVKGTIAFAGTMAMGEAARWFYKSGRHMEPGEHRRVFREALTRADALTGRVNGWLPTLGGEQREELARAISEEGTPLPGWVENADVWEEPSASPPEAAAELPPQASPVASPVTPSPDGSPPVAGPPSSTAEHQAESGDVPPGDHPRPPKGVPGQKTRPPERLRLDIERGPRKKKDVAAEEDRKEQQ